MTTEIRYNVTHIENIPASMWGKEINREITQMQVRVEDIRKIKNIVKIKPVPSILPYHVDSHGKYSCD